MNDYEIRYYITHPFVNNCSIKGPSLWYEMADGGYETIPDNIGICRFVWEHLNDILHCFCCTATTVSMKELFIAIPEVIILGHKCNFDGCILDDTKIAKIHDLPACQNLTDVCLFLETTGFMCIFKGYLTIVHPLVELMGKGVAFV
jgi:hypothetical protein